MISKDVFVRWSIAIAALPVLGACQVRASGFIEPPPPLELHASVSAPQPQASVNVQVGQPQLEAGVTVVQASCVQGAQEQCNGLDDNCNGQIDEGCGYQSGQVQITLAWNTGADIDMYVTDPQGQTLSYQNTQVASGGFLDHDARGNCRTDQTNNRIENVYWNSAQPPSGNYEVALHYWGECNSGGPTQSTTSIAVGGRIIGAYNFTLTPNQRVTIARFNIP